MARPAADPRLGAVRAAADPERVRSLLADWFARRGLAEQVESVAVQRLFFLPGSDFTAVYALSLRRGGETETQLLFGNIRYAGDAAAQAAKAEHRAASGKLVLPRLGSPTYYLPDLDMVLWTFPNDPRLKTLAANLRPEVVRSALERLGGPPLQEGSGQANGRRDGPGDGSAAAPGDGGWKVGGFHRTLVRYIPRKRCVFRYAIEWRRDRRADGTSGEAPSALLQHVYAKVYDDDAALQQAWQAETILWRAALGDGRWLRVPLPLYLDVEQLALYQTALPGAHLTTAAEAVTTGQAAGIGRGLALLQQTRVPLRPALPLEDELEKVRATSPLVAAVHPGFASRLQEIESRLAALLPGLPRLPLVPCHGTFKLNHLLQDGASTGLVDFDSMVLADPLYDVANFTADLHYLEAQGALPAGRGMRLGRAFYESWCTHVPWGRRDAVLEWYVASLLVRKQALKPVKHLHPDAPAKIERLLQAARERLGG